MSVLDIFGIFHSQASAEKKKGVFDLSFFQLFDWIFTFETIFVFEGKIFVIGIMETLDKKELTSPSIAVKIHMQLTIISMENVKIATRSNYKGIVHRVCTQNYLG